MNFGNFRMQLNTKYRCMYMIYNFTIIYFTFRCTLKIRLPGTSRSHLTSLLSHLIGLKSLPFLRTIDTGGDCNLQWFSGWHINIITSTYMYIQVHVHLKKTLFEKE